MMMWKTMQHCGRPLVLIAAAAALSMAGATSGAMAGPQVTPTPTEVPSNAQENPRPALGAKDKGTEKVLEDSRPQSQREAKNPIGVDEDVQQAERPGDDEDVRAVPDDTGPQSEREATNPIGEDGTRQ